MGNEAKPWWLLKLEAGLMRGPRKPDVTRATLPRKATQMSILLTYLTVMMIGAWTLEALFFAVQWRAFDRTGL